MHSICVHEKQNTLSLNQHCFIRKKKASTKHLSITDLKKKVICTQELAHFTSLLFLQAQMVNLLFFNCFLVFLTHINAFPQLLFFHSPLKNDGQGFQWNYHTSTPAHECVHLHTILTSLPVWFSCALSVCSCC